MPVTVVTLINQGGKMAFAEDFEQALKARVPVVYVQTHEETRLHAEVLSVAGRQRVPRPVWTWNAGDGLASPAEGSRGSTVAPARALETVQASAEAGIYMFFDLHAFFGTDQRPADPEVVRRVREAATAFRTGEHPRLLVITGPVLRIPPELEKTVAILDFPLPGRAELSAMLDTMIEQNGGSISVQLGAEDHEDVVQAALGLTMAEAENAFARAMVNDGQLCAADVATVLQEKRQAVRKSGLLDYVDAGLDLDRVGGLNNLKRWLARRQRSWLGEAEAFGLPSPKGVLITGVPGCGKSLTAKATAASWGLPLLRLDMGRVFAGLVGSSEQNMRSALATAEAISPCVLWIDEIEKGFSGTSSDGDSGTAARVFASFLTWMQEKRHPVFVVATANNIDRLPPEFLRKGRFDEIFFVDLPTDAERRIIWELQIAGGATPANGLSAAGADPEVVGGLVKASQGYSGAEIEQAVVAAMYDAFAEHRQVTPADLERAVTNMIPLSVTQAEEIARVRGWARLRAVGATAREDLDDDAVPAAAAATAPAGPPPADRGGRTVDF